MAVKTLFTGDDFVEILSRYNLGAYVGSQPIHEGTVQTNYCLETTQGRFVLRYYENRSRESVLFERDLLLYLNERHYPCPAPFANVQSEYVGVYREKPCVVFEFIEGRPVEHPGAFHQQQLIQKAAELQRLTEGFCSAYTPYRWNYDPDLCWTLARTEAARINTGNAQEKCAWLAHELTTLDLPPTSPKGICHCDFHFSNVLFRGDEFAALLDFDDANWTFLQFDLVGLIESGAWPHTAAVLDLTAARRVVQGYTAHRPLSPAEQKHLYDVYKLSILFDCVWYLGRGDADDFREKRKIEALTHLGRQRLFDELFHN